MYLKSSATNITIVKAYSDDLYWPFTKKVLIRSEEPTFTQSPDIPVKLFFFFFRNIDRFWIKMHHVYLEENYCAWRRAICDKFVQILGKFQSKTSSFFFLFLGIEGQALDLLRSFLRSPK